MPGLPTAAFRAVGQDHAIPDGFVVPFYLNDRQLRISVARAGDRLYAFDDLCTCAGHACPLSGGRSPGRRSCANATVRSSTSPPAAWSAVLASVPLNVYDARVVDGSIRASRSKPLGGPGRVCPVLCAARGESRYPAWCISCAGATRPSAPTGTTGRRSRRWCGRRWPAGRSGPPARSARCLVSLVRLRTVSPVAGSSRRTRSANAATPISSSMSCAVRSCARASPRRMSRRSHSPYSRWARASSTRSRGRSSRSIDSGYTAPRRARLRSAARETGPQA